MDLRELESYRLADAIKFNDSLNPKIWGPDEHLRPEVRQALMAMAEDFKEFLGIDVEVKDITISGSNAAYTYTDHSDIDLHLVADLPRADASEVYRELFDAKKYQYNDQHDYRIGPYEVELYVQDARQPHVSQGIYSVMNDRWLRVPSRRKPQIDDISVRSKYEDLGQRVDRAIASGDLQRMDRLAEKIRNMRQAGLAKTGEFGPENLAFKVLRGNGTLQRLRDARMAAKDRVMSLAERKKRRRRRTYGYGGYWYPGYGYYAQTSTDAGATDAGGDGGGEGLEESKDILGVLDLFTDFCATRLGLETRPRIKVKRDPAWSQRNGTFGKYLPDDNLLIVSVAGRHPVDIMRTLAHELTHHRQSEITEIPPNAGETGTSFEDQANAMAGRIMRDFAEQHPSYFKQRISEQLDRPTHSAQDIIKRHGVQEKDLIDQLKKGIEVELEHTRDPRVAIEIALDHLWERPDYYDMLAAVERPMGEGMREKIGALAAAACVAGTPGCATTDTSTADVVRGVQTVGRVAKNLPTRAGAEEELRQELKNWIRRQGGATDQPTRLPVPDIRKDQSTPESISRVGPQVPVQQVPKKPQKKRVEPVPPTQRPRTQYSDQDPKTPGKIDIEVKESSGYIPTDAEKNDPRFKMALTVDVRPGQTGKEANKLGLKTDSQGRPQLLMKKLQNLLEDVKSGVEEATAGPPRTVKATQQQISDLMDMLGRTPNAELKQRFLQVSKDILHLKSDNPSWALGELTRRAMGLHKTFYSQTTWQWVNDLIKLRADLNLGYQKHPDGPNIERDVNDFLNRQGMFRFPIRKNAPVAEFESKLQEKCWTGYRQQGMKKKGGRQVPNCVKIDEFLSNQVGGGDDGPGDDPQERLLGLAKALQQAMYGANRNKADTQRIKREIENLGATLRPTQSEHGYDVALFHPQHWRAGILITPAGVGMSAGPLTEDEDLTEVKMSPGELEKWARSDEAQGIQAGFEAELIFRDTSREDEQEEEPDYGADERASSIDDVLDFFSNDEYGFGLYGTTLRRLRDALVEDYGTWQQEAIDNAWYEDEENQVRDYMESNVWGDDTEQDQYRERAAEDLGVDTSEESAERSQEIEERARALFDQDVAQAISDQDRYYDEAREYYSEMMADSGDFDEENFFEDRYPYMSDVANSFELDWPILTGGRHGPGERSIEDIADSLRGVVDGEVRASSGYHGAARRPGRWIVEPDGSLEPDDSDEAGLEIVSPPMPLPQALESLRRVIDWANGPGDAYTNDSTGLHMGISIPHKGGAVDYVKLILFMGDKYVLEKFGREANSYTRSALAKLQDLQRARRQGVMEATAGQEKTAAAMDLMKKNLIELAADNVRGGVGQDKYTSAHIKDGYIEFRSPGGDYLSMDSRDESALRDTMLRFARAMYLAGRPDLERKEYGKKLYKLIDAQGDDALGLFLKYSTGEIGSETLKKEWARQVLAKEAPPDENAWEILEPTGQTDDSGEPIVRVVGTIQAANRMDALRVVQDNYRNWFNLEVRPKQAADDEPAPTKPASRRAQVAKKIVERPTVWHVEDTNTGKVLLIAARNIADARTRAELQDPEFEKLRRSDPDSFLVTPATREEIIKYQRQELDRKQDSREVEKSVNDRRNMFPYTVTWRETRDGREFGDSLNLDAESADAAVDSIRRTLGYMGRTVVPGSIQARPREEPGYEPGASRQDQSGREYQIVNPETGIAVVAFRADTDREAYERIERYRQQHPSINVSLRTGGSSSTADRPVPGSTLDLQRQRADQEAQQRGAWTGRWQVRNRAGEVVYTFGGIGNSQADANRTANTWLISQGDRFDDQGPFEVVPERGIYGSEN